MINLLPQNIRDANIKILLEELEDLEDVKLYDEAKKDDDGKRILFLNYFNKTENRRIVK